METPAEQPMPIAAQEGGDPGEGLRTPTRFNPYALAKAGALYLLVVPLLFRAIAGWAYLSTSTYSPNGADPNLAKAFAFFSTAWYSSNPLTGTADAWTPTNASPYFWDWTLHVFLFILGACFVFARVRVGALIAYGVHVLAGFYVVIKTLVDPERSFFGFPAGGYVEDSPLNGAATTGQVVGAVLAVGAIILIVVGILARAGTGSPGAPRDPATEEVLAGQRARRYTLASIIATSLVVLGPLAAVLNKAFAAVTLNYGAYDWRYGDPDRGLVNAIFSGPAPANSLLLPSNYDPYSSEESPLAFFWNKPVLVGWVALLLIAGLAFVFTRKRVGAWIVYSFLYAALPVGLVSTWTNGSPVGLTLIVATVSSVATGVAVALIMVGVSKAPTKPPLVVLDNGA